MALTRMVAVRRFLHNMKWHNNGAELFVEHVTSKIYEMRGVARVEAEPPYQPESPVTAVAAIAVAQVAAAPPDPEPEPVPVAEPDQETAPVSEPTDQVTDPVADEPVRPRRVRAKTAAELAEPPDDPVPESESTGDSQVADRSDEGEAQVISPNLKPAETVDAKPVDAGHTVTDADEGKAA